MMHKENVLNSHWSLFNGPTLLAVTVALGISSSIAQQIDQTVALSSLETKNGSESAYNRISRDEAIAIRICRGLVAAERLFYVSQQHGYTQKILSDPGKHDGLYWKSDNSEDPSPLEQVILSAVSDGFAKAKDGASIPYDGYLFGFLTTLELLHQPTQAPVRAIAQ